MTNADFFGFFGNLVGTSNVAVLDNLGDRGFKRPYRIAVGRAAEAIADFEWLGTGGRHLVTANRDDGTLSVVKNNHVLLASDFEWGDTYPWSDTVSAMP